MINSKALQRCYLFTFVLAVTSGWAGKWEGLESGKTVRNLSWIFLGCLHGGGAVGTERKGQIDLKAD